MTLSKGSQRHGQAWIALGAALLATTGSASTTDYAEALVVGTPPAVRENPRIAPDLAAVRDMLLGADLEGRRTLNRGAKGHRAAPMFRVSGERMDRLQVYVALDDWSESARASLAHAGATIECLDERRHIVQASVSIDRLDVLAGLAGVRQVRLPNYALASAGSIDNEGDSSQGTIFVRRLEGVRGTGSRVGVLSNGLFQSDVAWLYSEAARSTDARLLEGDLPATMGDEGVVVQSGYFGDTRVFPGDLSQHVAPDGDYAEGAAMLEEIHDIAPDARLYFGISRTDAEIAAARQSFNLPGLNLDVVADNVSFIGAGRYDGTSAVSQGAAEFARTKNIPYFVSVGSYTPPVAGATSAGRFPMFVNGYFNPDRRQGRAKSHSWASPQNPVRDEALSIDSQADSSGVDGIDVTLVWDDFWDDQSPRATDDLDLYLVDRDTLNLTSPIAIAATLQNGQGSNPVEHLVWVRPSFYTRPVALVMRRKDQTNNASTLFTLTISQGTVIESDYLTHGIPLNNADALAPVISVGDIDSSIGATTVDPNAIPGLDPGVELARAGSFFRWYETQDVPTCLGYGSISTLTTLEQNFRFAGPSSAVPNLAGFAALLRQRFPKMPANRIHQLFQDTSGRADDGSAILPCATLLTYDSLEGYDRAPKLRRTEPYNVYGGLVDGKLAPYADGLAARTFMTPVVEKATKWIQGPPDGSTPFPKPEFLVTDQGLAIHPGSQGTYGYWESPLVYFQATGDEAPRTTLRTDRLYVAEVRVGSNEHDANRVPDFRLRLTTGAGEEAATLSISSLTGAGSAPIDLGGRVYRLFYQPTSRSLANQGMRLSFEVMNFNPNDNPDATIVLQDVTIREVLSPSLAP